MLLLRLSLKLIISTLVVFGCEPVGGATACSDDTQCSLAEACQNGVCIDPCKTTHCRDPNSVCVNLEHKTKCVCKYGFVLDKNNCKPKNSHISPSGLVKCTDKAQCKPAEACHNGFCTVTCMNLVCRPNAVCIIVHPEPKCLCKYGFVLGKGGCKPVPSGRSSEKSISKTRFEFVDVELPWGKARSYCSERGMKLATVENAEKKSELERFIQTIGHKELKTPQSSYYDFSPLPSRRFKFKFKATREGGVGLLTFSKINKFSEDRMVQLSVGSFQPESLWLSLRTNHYEPYTWEREIPNIVPSKKFQGFWIDFGRVYRLGKENEETPLMTWEDPEPFYVNYFGIHSEWGSSVWSFYGETVTTRADQDNNNLYNYTRLPQFSLDITVRANEGVQIALTSGPQDTSPMYEILLGGWRNTASAIRYQADIVKVDTPGLLSALEGRRFRISWKGGVVKVVNQYGEMVMELQNKEYVEITHYGLMSPRGEASWGVIVTDDVNGLATTGRLWLGGEQLEGDQLKWLGSGQPVTSDWYIGEINKGFTRTRAKKYIGHCLSTAPMVFGINGTLNNLQWYKANCFTEFKFICERTVK